MSNYEDYLKRIFKELGFTRDHAAVYYEALKLGKAPVQDISRGSGVPRSSCYDIIDRLNRYGLVSSVKEEGKTLIIAEDPELIYKKIWDIIDRKNEALRLYKDISNHLNILGYQKTSDQVDVRLLKGFESMKKVLFDILEKVSKDKELLNICQGEADKYVGLSRDPKYLKEFVKERNKKKIKERAILEDMRSAREYKSKYESKDYEILLSPQNESKETAHIDKYILGDYVYILNFKKDYAIIIRDSYFAENERNTFNVLWNVLKSKL